MAFGTRKPDAVVCALGNSSANSFHDRRAAGRLHSHHARPLWPNPAHLLHLVKRFPHTNQTSAASSWIKDHIRKLPVELLGQFITQRLFSFNAIRLFQG
jgi:hypothetical protein